MAGDKTFGPKNSQLIFHFLLPKTLLIPADRTPPKDTHTHKYCTHHHHHQNLLAAFN